MGRGTISATMSRHIFLFFAIGLLFGIFDVCNIIVAAKWTSTFSKFDSLPNKDSQHGFDRNSLRCNFAQDFSTEEIVRNAVRREAFIDYVLNAEGKFHQPWIAYHPISGMTFDGHIIDPKTGELLAGGLHNFSSPAKDSQHLSLLALVLDGNSRAIKFFNSSMNGLSSIKTIQLQAIQLLTLKINALEQWNARLAIIEGWFFDTVMVDLFIHILK